MRIAGRLLRDQVLERDQRILAQFLARESESTEALPVLFSNEVVHVATDEVPVMGRRMEEALRQDVRLDPAERPADARRVYVAIHGVPWEDV